MPGSRPRVPRQTAPRGGATSLRKAVARVGLGHGRRDHGPLHATLRSRAWRAPPQILRYCLEFKLLKLSVRHFVPPPLRTPSLNTLRRPGRKPSIFLDLAAPPQRQAKGPLANSEPLHVRRAWRIESFNGFRALFPALMNEIRSEPTPCRNGKPFRLEYLRTSNLVDAFPAGYSLADGAHSHVRITNLKSAHTQIVENRSPHL